MAVRKSPPRRQIATSFQFEGTLDTTSFATVLYKMHARGLTGQLRLDDVPGAPRVIHVLRGAPVLADSGSHARSLGATLLRAGMVDVDTLTRALDARQEGEQLGACLLRLNELTPAKLHHALDQQVRERILACCDLSAGVYRFTPGISWPEGTQLFPQSGLALVVEGVRRHVPVNALAEAMSARMDQYIVPTDRLSILWNDYPRSAARDAVEPFLRGVSTLRDIVTGAGGHPMQILRELHSMEVTHLIRFAAEPREEPTQPNVTRPLPPPETYGLPARSSPPKVTRATSPRRSRSIPAERRSEITGAHAAVDSVVARHLVELREFETAFRRVRAALERDPHNVGLRILKAWIVFQLPHRDPARKARVCRNQLETLLAMESSAEGFFYLGVVERTMGDNDLARRHFRLALAQDPNHAAARSELVALDAVETTTQSARQTGAFGRLWSQIFDK